MREDERSDAHKFAEDFMRRNSDAMRAIARHNEHPNNAPCTCYGDGNVNAELGKPSVLGKR